MYILGNRGTLGSRFPFGTTPTLVNWGTSGLSSYSHTVWSMVMSLWGNGWSCPVCIYGVLGSLFLYLFCKLRALLPFLCPSFALFNPFLALPCLSWPLRGPRRLDRDVTLTLAVSLMASSYLKPEQLQMLKNQTRLKDFGSPWLQTKPEQSCIKLGLRLFKAAA